MVVSPQAGAIRQVPTSPQLEHTLPRNSGTGAGSASSRGVSRSFGDNEAAGVSAFPGSSRIAFLAKLMPE